MSKQAKAKLEQQYREKPVFPMCTNCKYMNSEITYPDPTYPAWFKEKVTCSLGGFVVKKLGTCNLHTEL